MCDYLILDNKRPSPNFDAHIYGLLLNNKNEIIPNPFYSGQILNADNKFIIEAISKGSESGKFRDKLSVTIQNNEALFIVSKELQLVLKEVCHNIEFYELTICMESKYNFDYKIANISNIINCVNHEDSSLVYWESSHETIYNINELVLDEQLIPPNSNMFLMGEIKGTVIVVHKRFRDLIQKSKITGFSFSETVDFVL